MQYDNDLVVKFYVNVIVQHCTDFGAQYCRRKSAPLLGEPEPVAQIDTPPKY